MFRILFWNVNRHAVQSHVARLVQRHRVDLLLLAESVTSPPSVLNALPPPLGLRFRNVPTVCPRIQVHTRVSVAQVAEVRDSSYFTIRRFSGPPAGDLLIIAAHLPSELWYRQGTPRLACENLADEVARVERLHPTHASIVIGDLNVNPYDEGVINANALHAVGARQVAARGQRTVLGRLYPLFYNPSWRLLADSARGPGGTYYRASNDVNCVFWNVIDQVLVRPSLIPRLPVDCLRVLDNDGQVSFRRQPSGVPDARVSDHLPILFTLKA